jgi:hypothetical protein
MVLPPIILSDERGKEKFDLGAGMLQRSPSAPLALQRFGFFFAGFTGRSST